MPNSSIFTRRAVNTGLAAALLSAAVAPALGANPGAARVSALAHGFNLTDWIDRDDGIAPSVEVLQALKAFGFGSIRLPINPDQFGLADHDMASAALARLDAAVTLLTDVGFAVIVDMHSSPIIGGLFDTAPEQAERALQAAWTALAPHLANTAPDRVFAELLNEPPMDRTNWLALREQLAAIVRRACPDHTIIWGAARYQGIWETLGTPPLKDTNAIVAVHYYTPLGFTHQCENWNGSVFSRFENLPFPAKKSAPEVKALAEKFRTAGDTEALAALNEEFSGPWSQAHIDADFADLALWSKQHRCPAIVNEFGVLNFCADSKSRANWTRDVRQAAESHSVGWCYWELDQGFGFIKDRNSLDGFDRDLINALLPAP